jgi:exodeoxyribonuclease VIII
MANFMIDLETLGTKPDAAVVQIGIVDFDDTGAGMPFSISVVPHEKSSMDFSTIQWWMGQSEEARKSVFEGQFFSPKEALEQINAHIAAYTKDEPPVIWSKPSTFDTVILESLYRQCDMVPPWKHWNTRCLRTLLDVSRLPYGEQVTPDIAHDAGSDASAQAKTAVKCIKLINKA